MNNRIGLLLKVKDVTASKFADMIGVQPSNISHILSGRNKPSLDFVMKVSETFPDISLEWLMFGRGSMFIHDETQDANIESDSEITEKSLQVAENSGIPDLFSQDYLPENSKIEEISDKDVEQRSINDENLLKENNFEKGSEDLEEVGKELPDLSSEEIIENENFQKQDNSEFHKHDHKVEQTDHEKVVPETRVFKPGKPARIILIYDDETFEMLDIKGKV